MNKIWLWFLSFFTSTKALPKITVIESSSPVEKPASPVEKPASDLNFLLELKKAKQEALDPQLTEELRISIEKNLGKLLGERYKNALIANNDIIFITESEVKDAGIIIGKKDGWLTAKTHIVKYLKSVGIEAAFYSDYVDVRAKDVTKVLDSIPDAFQEEGELAPPFSTGVYR